MSYYKARILELENSRLKLIEDARAAREECEKLKETLKRLRAKAKQGLSQAPSDDAKSHLKNP